MMSLWFTGQVWAGGDIVCCTTVWCLCLQRRDLGQVFNCLLYNGILSLWFTGQIWTRCLHYPLNKGMMSLFSQDRSGPGVVPRARSSGGGGYGSHASVGLHHQPRVHLLMQWHYRHQAIGISGGEVRAIGVLLFETDIFSEKITFVQCDTAVLYFASLSFACCSVDGYQVFPFIDWQKR